MQSWWPRIVFGLGLAALELPAAEAVPGPPPTYPDVAYGAHERQVLDVWLPGDARRARPVVLHIHGGGWVNGDKRRVPDLEHYLAAGLAVVSINYRFVQHAIGAGVTPPVTWPLQDAARALQFVRSRAGEWRLDRERIGATGSSAGACSSLWLAFHADMADAGSADPVSRESTRLWCVAAVRGQTTLDPAQMQAWTPNSRYGGHAFGFWPEPGNLRTRDTAFAAFRAERERLLPWIKAYSPFEHVSPDDPPVYLFYTTPPALGREERDPTHTANLGLQLHEHLQANGVKSELVYPDAPDVRHATAAGFLIAALRPTEP